MDAHIPYPNAGGLQEGTAWTQAHAVRQRQVDARTEGGGCTGKSRRMEKRERASTLKPRGKHEQSTKKA